MNLCVKIIDIFYAVAEEFFRADFMVRSLTFLNKPLCVRCNTPECYFVGQPMNVCGTSSAVLLRVENVYVLCQGNSNVLDKGMMVEATRLATATNE